MGGVHADIIKRNTEPTLTIYLSAEILTTVAGLDELNRPIRRPVRNKFCCIYCGLPVGVISNRILYVIDNGGYTDGRLGAISIMCKRCGQDYQLVV